MDIQQVKTEQQLRVLEKLAGEIWHEYFPSILSEEQIDYMVEKFQSYRAIREQLSGGYAYFLCCVLMPGYACPFSRASPDPHDSYR